MGNICPKTGSKIYVSYLVRFWEGDLAGTVVVPAVLTLQC